MGDGVRGNRGNAAAGGLVFGMYSALLSRLSLSVSKHGGEGVSWDRGSAETFSPVLMVRRAVSKPRHKSRSSESASERAGEAVLGVEV